MPGTFPKAKDKRPAAIAEMDKSAKQTKDPKIVKAAMAMKQKWGNAEQAREKLEALNKDPDKYQKVFENNPHIAAQLGQLITKHEDEAEKLYNACAALVSKAETAATTPVVPTGTWKVVEKSGFVKEAGLVQDGAESKKLKSWMGGIKKLGPFASATANGIKCTPMSGKEYHVYLGKANRVYFEPDEKTQTCTLTGVKHK